MKEFLMKHMETFIYGILSMIFSAAFFFGVLYPSQGFSPDAYRTMHEPRSHGRKTVAESVMETYPERDFLRKAKEYDPEEIECTFFLYECLKNS